MRLRMIRSGSTDRSDPVATRRRSPVSSRLKKSTGAGGNVMGPYVDATVNREGWRTRSILCLSTLAVCSDSSIRPEKRRSPHWISTSSLLTTVAENDGCFWTAKWRTEVLFSCWRRQPATMSRRSTSQLSANEAGKARRWTVTYVPTATPSLLLESTRFWARLKFSKWKIRPYSSGRFSFASHVDVRMLFRPRYLTNRTRAMWSTGTSVSSGKSPSSARFLRSSSLARRLSSSAFKSSPSISVSLFPDSSSFSSWPADPSPASSSPSSRIPSCSSWSLACGAASCMSWLSSSSS
mmetsp:Transcript_19869/g.34186  ORF Transcript_19869/g.34186 Transcript_19869/m.34186 type:complete len:294 (+) Transcript_19869:546-1427(+)